MSGRPQRRRSFIMRLKSIPAKNVATSIIVYALLVVAADAGVIKRREIGGESVPSADLDIVVGDGQPVHNGGDSDAPKVDGATIATVRSTKLSPQVIASDNVILEMLKERTRDSLLRVEKMNYTLNGAVHVSDGIDRAVLLESEESTSQRAIPMQTTTEYTMPEVERVSVDVVHEEVASNTTSDELKLIPSAQPGTTLVEKVTEKEQPITTPIRSPPFTDAPEKPSMDVDMSSRSELALHDLASISTKAPGITHADLGKHITYGPAAVTTTTQKPTTKTKVETESKMIKATEVAKESLLPSNHHSGMEKRAKFINDNSTNAQQLNLPEASEVWSLAAMKSVPAVNATTERSADNHTAATGGNSEKNLLDWTQIMLNANLGEKLLPTKQSAAMVDSRNGTVDHMAIVASPTDSPLVSNEVAIGATTESGMKNELAPATADPHDVTTNLNTTPTTTTTTETTSSSHLSATTLAAPTNSLTSTIAVPTDNNDNNTKVVLTTTSSPRTAAPAMTSAISSGAEEEGAKVPSVHESALSSGERERNDDFDEANKETKVTAASPSTTSALPLATDEPQPITMKTLPEITHSHTSSSASSDSTSNLHEHTPDPTVASTPAATRIPTSTHNASLNDMEATLNANKGIASATKNKSANGSNPIDGDDDAGSDYDADDEGDDIVGGNNHNENINNNNNNNNNNQNNNNYDDDEPHRLSASDADVSAISTSESGQPSGGKATHERILENTTKPTATTATIAEDSGTSLDGKDVVVPLTSTTPASTGFDIGNSTVASPTEAIPTTKSAATVATTTTTATTIENPLPSISSTNLATTEIVQIAHNEVGIDSKAETEAEAETKTKTEVEADLESATVTVNDAISSSVSSTNSSVLLITTTTTATTTTTTTTTEKASEAASSVTPNEATQHSASGSVHNELEEVPITTTTTTTQTPIQSTPPAIVVTTAVALGETVTEAAEKNTETEAALATNVIDLSEQKDSLPTHTTPTPTATSTPTAATTTTVIITAAAESTSSTPDRDDLNESAKTKETEKSANESDGDTMSPVNVDIIYSTPNPVTASTSTPPPLISLLDDSTTTTTTTTSSAAVATEFSVSTSTSIPLSVSTKIEEVYSVFSTTPAPSSTESTKMTIPTVVSLPPQIDPAPVIPSQNGSLSGSAIPIPTYIQPANPYPTAGGGAILHPDLASIGNFHPNRANASGMDTNVIVAIVLSCVGVVALILVVAFLYLMRKRQKQMSYGQRCRPVSLDAYSLDNVSVLGSVRRKGAQRASKRSYGNVAFDDPSLRHNVLTPAELARFVERRSSIFEEFRDVPQIIARADEVPTGCEDKNRYANVIPLPETRVILQQQNGDEKTEYINANYVRGPKDAPNYYIACQAPLEITVADFWRMIWEQQSRVIIQATDLIENGIEKCAEYLPPSVTLDNHTTYGDFQVTLKNREVKDKYAISTIMLKNTLEEASRELTHYWYKWPETGVPNEETAIIAMLLEARASLKSYAIEQANELKSSTMTLKVDSLSNSDGKASALSDENDKRESSGNSNGVANGTNGEINGNVSNDKVKAVARNQGPLTIHCSPGTGRTGTIIAIDIAIRCLETPRLRNVDIPQIVYYVRRGRASAVQTKEQYEFIYKVANMYATKITSLSNDN